jgi:hypothetical protein
MDNINKNLGEVKNNLNSENPPQIKINASQ